jgi:hypothetical protein
MYRHPDEDVAPPPLAQQIAQLKRDQHENDREQDREQRREAQPAHHRGSQHEEERDQRPGQQVEGCRATDPLLREGLEVGVRGFYLALRSPPQASVQAPVNLASGPHITSEWRLTAGCIIARRDFCPRNPTRNAGPSAHPANLPARGATAGEEGPGTMPAASSAKFPAG